MKRVLVSAIVIAITISGTAYAAAKRHSNANVRGVVLFVGDSNLMVGAQQIVEVATYDNHFDNGYIPAFASRVGAGLRTFDCPGNPFTDPSYHCPTYNYWAIRLPKVLARVKPNAIVVNLGVNDTFAPGNKTSQGYAQYGAKIDGFMRLLPKGMPVLWTNLPCKIEPAPDMYGCNLVNKAIAHAPTRWPHLSIVKWGGVANGHPEWIFAHDVHYNPYGDTAWADTVVAALDERMKSVA